MIDKRPLIYYCIAFLFGCYSALFILNNNFFGAALAASFLACIFITQKSKLSYVAAVFLILGYVNYYLYYSLVPPQNFPIRIDKVQSYYSTGSYLGRKFVVKGNVQGVAEGEKLYINGSYVFNPQYDKGIIGDIEIKSISGRKKDFISKLYTFKRKLYEKYEANMGEKPAAEVMAACFGDDSYMGQDTMQEMSSLGIVHVISVSGLHMALIYKVCEMFLGFGWGIALSIVYCLFTGAAPPTVRSLIMIIVLKLSKRVYKNYDALSSLSLAGIIVVAVRPANAMDAGTILSFLAMLGIFLHYEKIRKALYLLPEKLNESISLTFSAQVYSLPVCISMFNSASTAMLQGNILIVPIYSLLLILGNISLPFINIDFLFKFFCFFLKVAYEAIEGGRYILDRISSKPIFLSSIDGWVLVIIYVSYMLYKRRDRRFVWLPLFSVIFYVLCSFSPVPEFKYVKIGYNNAIIYRNGFKSVLFTDMEKYKGGDMLLRKKFNVGAIHNVDSKEDFAYRDKSLNFVVKHNNNGVLLNYLNGKAEVNMCFCDETIPVSGNQLCDIIYLPYKKTGYYYDELICIVIVNGKPIKL